MPKALVIYATRSGQTKKIAHFVAEGIKLSGVAATVLVAAEIKREADLEGYDALVIGSPTYHSEMMQSVKTLLAVAEKASLQGKIGGAFGAYGWSGEAPDQIFDAMKNILKMNMVNGSLKLKSALIVDGEQTARDYGCDIANRIGH
jgi:flavorubredoxin